MTITVLDYGLGQLSTVNIILDYLDSDIKDMIKQTSSCPFQLNVDDAINAIKLKEALIRNGCNVSCTSEPDELNYEDVSTKNLQLMECDGKACLELSKRYAHGTTLLQCDRERSKELRRLGMLYLYGSTVSPEFE